MRFRNLSPDDDKDHHANGEVKAKATSGLILEFLQNSTLQRRLADHFMTDAFQFLLDSVLHKTVSLDFNLRINVTALVTFSHARVTKLENSSSKDKNEL
jgi:hypothetical protein